ncbi:COR domain-containing protein [Syntrophus gentianae]|uniref:COR domain-containing protein n=1 Tax=Syntrophus gentianae TaxID=43775 RepID=UPI000B8A262B|nr:COR domain-containing protein [Syntrophus gentianae]
MFTVLRSVNAALALIKRDHLVTAVHAADTAAYSNAAYASARVAHDADGAYAAARAAAAADAAAYAAVRAADAADAAANVFRAADAAADAADAAADAVANAAAYAAYATATAAHATDAAAYAAARAAADAADTAADAAVNADMIVFTNDKVKLGVQWLGLWLSPPPGYWDNLFQEFLSDLRQLGLGYWADECQNWFHGRFDWEKLERCLFMPSSTIEAGVEAMLAYLQAETLVRMNEARVVFLGEGEAGKTSLIRCLFDEEIRGDEPATPRIDVRQRSERIDGNMTHIHYWDFGGQVIMHATHQFFLREKSVYVVVLDIRRCDSLEYWLDHVRVFAANAPTLIVLNKVDRVLSGMATRPSFDLKAIRRRYPFVVDQLLLVSCATKDGIKEFLEALQSYIAGSHILKADMPEPWFLVKEELTRQNQDFITREQFSQICHSQNVENDHVASTLNVLDKLGVAIHFPTLPVQDVVLNPQWITKAIYFIILANERKHLNGKLDVGIIRDLFSSASPEELDIEVPEDKYAFLLDLMTEFKLAFRSRERDGLYLVPMLAQTDEPLHNVPREGGLKFVFSLPFLPPALFYRFIAESGKDLDDERIWRTGAILIQGNTRALVEYSDYQRTISLIVHGPDAGNYLTTLRQRLMMMLGKNYRELEYDLHAITPQGERINWLDAIQRFEREGENARIYTDRNSYSLKDLLMIILGQLNNLQYVVNVVNTEFSIVRMMQMSKGDINVNVSPAFHVDPEINPTINPSFEQNPTISVSVTQSVEFSTVNELKSDLQRMKEILEDFQEDEPGQATQYEKQLRSLIRDIDRIEKDIDDLKAQADSNESEKRTLLTRIKDRWEEFAEKAKQCYYVTGMVEKAAKAAGWLDKIDWNNLL